MPRKNSSEPLIDGIQKSGLVQPGVRLLVAVSGGPDSTALLVAMHELGFDITAAHFDHALREGSEKVAEQVGTLCTGLNVELVAERRDSPMPRGSVQAAARALRYEFLGRARGRTGAQAVALAHTADDLVEGAALHLMRGCGLAGLRGMPASRGAYVRPMLEVWRSEVVEFLEKRGVSAYEDPANADLKFARARLRHQILPELERDRPGIRRRFFAAARQASATQEAIEVQAQAVLVAGPPAGWEVARMPQPVAVELIKLLYAHAGGSLPALSRRHLASMLDLARGGRGGRGVDLPCGLRFRIVGHHMEVIPTADRLAQVRSVPQLDVRECLGCDDPEAAHLRPDLSVRVGFRQPGLRMRPAGGRGSRKLQDILVDARVPREARDSWPLVFAGDQLAWVPGITVDADLASVAGQPALHVAISPMPDRWTPKVARLETPNSPRGESS
ncbi:MAG TPA: tRNA lysidine(34) synthetase TilS [Candidatus Dormibacteraeota bacterium]|nr:tRNA lysidine(34) synthetase TilS [Candidatus Dormibacteraeota bacterium]